ncbi:MAG: biopolymer transporter ExbD [Gemmataceae bacterium]
MAGKAYHGEPTSQEGVQMDLIITPMLDMAFQLLAFFVVTYNPAAIEVHIDGRLLPPDKPAISGPQDQPPEIEPEVMPTDDPPPEVEEFVVVYVKAGTTTDDANDGKPLEIRITTNQHPDPKEAWKTIVIENDESVELPADSNVKHYEPAMQQLTKWLMDRKERLEGTEYDLKLKLDKSLKHVYVVRTWDACHLSGIRKIGFLPPAN